MSQSYVIQTHNFLNFRAFFAYFDESKCRWVEEENFCEENIADYDATVSSESDSFPNSASGSENVSVYNTDVIDVSSIGDVTDTSDTINNEPMEQYNHPTITTTKIPLYQNLECEPLDDAWICSSGSKNLSLCIKFCTIGFDSLYFHKTQTKACLVKSKSFVLRLNRKKMVLLKTKNVCASKMYVTGLKKVLNVRSR